MLNQNQTMTSNEKQFFKDLASLEKIEYSEPLSIKEIEQIYYDVSAKAHISPLIEFVRRIENAHGIGLKHGRVKN